MNFIKDFLVNLSVLVLIALVLYVVFPDMMSQIFQLYGALLGPAAILIIIGAAIPRKKRRQRY